MTHRTQVVDLMRPDVAQQVAVLGEDPDVEITGKNEVNRTRSLGQFD